MLQRWNYKAINPSDSFAGVEVLSKDPEEALNTMGDDGWELVETVEESVGKTSTSFSSGLGHRTFAPSGRNDLSPLRRISRIHALHSRRPSSSRQSSVRQYDPYRDSS